MSFEELLYLVAGTVLGIISMLPVVEYQRRAIARYRNQLTYTIQMNTYELQNALRAFEDKVPPYRDLG